MYLELYERHDAQTKAKEVRRSILPYHVYRILRSFAGENFHKFHGLGAIRESFNRENSQ